MGNRAIVATIVAMQTLALVAPCEAVQAVEDDQTRPLSFVELGGYWGSEDSFKFGDFTGLEKRGFQFLGDLDIRRRAPWDSGDTWHWRLQGANLGLSSRSARAEGGLQGLFDVWVNFSDLPKFQTESVYSPYVGGGSLLTLPPNWIPSSSTAGFLRLDESLRRREIDHRRRNLGGGFSVQLPWSFELEASYNRETKEGDKLTAAIIGSNGGNPRAAIVPEDIDYDTQQVDVTLRFNGERGQLQFGYYLSVFDDHNDSLTWETAFLRPGGGNTWNPSASFPTGLGRKATPPDNRFHQISAAGGYDLGFWDTRVTGDVAFGWMRQDDSFLPFTVNPVLDASITRPLSRGDLDGKIDTTSANLRIDSRPLPKLRLNGRVRYDDRDNNTDRALYIYIPGDASPQGDLTGSTARINRPYSYQLKEYSVEVGYEIFRRTELSLAYEYEEIERTFSEVDETQQDTYGVSLVSRPNKYVSFRVKAERSERDRSDYRGELPFFQGTTRQHIADIPHDEQFENHPLLRKYYLADRNRDHVKGSVTVFPMDRLSLGFAIDNVNDDYKETELGLLHSRMFSYTFDASFSPCDGFSTHAFYTYEDFQTRQRGHSFSGNNILPHIADPTRRWTARETDAIDTFGVGFDLELLDGRFTLEGDTIYSRSRGSIAVKTNLMPAVVLPGTPTSFPDNTSHLFGASIGARFKITPAISVGAAYAYERLDVNDWAFENVTPSTLSNVLTTGQQSPDYGAHLVALSLRYEFR